MFDIGFWELTMLTVVALLVIGPERLPGVARTTGRWLGQARRMFTSLKAEIEQEANITELKESIEKQSQSINKLMDETLNSIEGQDSATKPSTTKPSADHDQ